MTRPTPEQVTARLRLAASLGRLDARPTHAVDYSPEAVTQRLREAADVSALCARLVVIGAEARRLARGG